MMNATSTKYSKQNDKAHATHSLRNLFPRVVFVKKSDAPDRICEFVFVTWDIGVGMYVESMLICLRCSCIFESVVGRFEDFGFHVRSGSRRA